MSRELLHGLGPKNTPGSAFPRIGGVLPKTMRRQYVKAVLKDGERRAIVCKNARVFFSKKAKQCKLATKAEREKGEKENEAYIFSL